MTSGSLIWIEVVLGFVVPVGWGVWQLIELRRLRRRDEEDARRQVTARAASGTAAGPAPSGD